MPINRHNRNILDAILKVKTARLGFRYVHDQGGCFGNREYEFQYFENEAAVDGVLYVIGDLNDRRSKPEPEFMRKFQCPREKPWQKMSLVQLIRHLKISAASKN